MSIKLAGKPTCPKCFKILDGASEADDPHGEAHPVEGDLCVCAYCCSVLEYQEERGEGSYHLMTESEFEDLSVELKHQINSIRVAVCLFPLGPSV